MNMTTNEMLNKLIAGIEGQIEEEKNNLTEETKLYYGARQQVRSKILRIIDSLQQEQPDNMIQWTGNNLKEVIDFTGKNPRLGEWFNSWEEYENYVHSHNDILKLFCDDGSHYEIPAGAWIVKTPDGYNVPSVAKYVQREQPDEQPEYGYLSTKYVRGKKPKWSVGDVLAYYIYTSNEEGEYPLGKIVNIQFDEDWWIYTFEDGNMQDEQSLIEEGAYKKN